MRKLMSLPPSFTSMTELPIPCSHGNPMPAGQSGGHGQEMKMTASSGAAEASSSLPLPKRRLAIPRDSMSVST
jgi:hypothetical protein